MRRSSARISGKRAHVQDANPTKHVEKKQKRIVPLKKRLKQRQPRMRVDQFGMCGLRVQVPSPIVWSIIRSRVADGDRSVASIRRHIGQNADLADSTLESCIAVMSDDVPHSGDTVRIFQGLKWVTGTVDISNGGLIMARIGENVHRIDGVEWKYVVRDPPIQVPDSDPDSDPESVPESAPESAPDSAPDSAPGSAPAPSQERRFVLVGAVPSRSETGQIPDPAPEPAPEPARERAGLSLYRPKPNKLAIEAAKRLRAMANRDQSGSKYSYTSVYTLED